MNHRLNIKAKTIMFLKKIIEKNLLDGGACKDF